MKIERYRWNRDNSPRVKEDIIAIAADCKVDSDIQTLWADPSTDFWIARSSYGDIVGFACLTYLKNRVAFLSNAAVRNDYRGGNVHGRLINARVRWANEWGFSTVVTYTTADNTASANNLMNYGFRLVKECPELDQWYNKPMNGPGFLLWEREEGVAR